MVALFRRALALSTGLAIASLPLAARAQQTAAPAANPASPAARLQTDDRAASDRQDLDRFFSFGNGRFTESGAYRLESQPCELPGGFAVVCARLGGDRVEPQILPALDGELLPSDAAN